jgi:hypothetical protein
MPNAPDLLDKELIVGRFPKLFLNSAHRLQVLENLIARFMETQMSDHDIRQILKVSNFLRGKRTWPSVHQA